MIIKKNRPVLAVCAYHKWDDLITILKRIKENLTSYVMMFRKYPTNIRKVYCTFLPNRGA